MKKSIKLLTVLLVLFALASTAVFAGNLVDYSVDPDICRFSDHISESTLPYIRFSAGKTEVDANVDKAGICFSNEEINVTSDMTDIQMFFSTYDIKVSSTIEHMISFSQKAIVTGKVTKTSAIFTNGAVISEGAQVDGNLFIFANDVTISGNVNGNIIVFANSVNITRAANITGSVRADISSLNIDKDSTVSGLVYAKYTDSVSVPDNLKDFVQTLKVEENSNVESLKTIPIMQIVLASLVIAALYILISAKTKLFTKMMEKLEKSTIKVIVSGFVTIFALPLVFILSILLCIIDLSVIGGTVMVAMLALIILAAILRVYVVGIIISEYMLKTKYGKYFDTNLKKFILAAIVFIILSLFEYIPVIGSYLVYLYVVITLGLVITLTVLFKTLKK